MVENAGGLVSFGKFTVEPEMNDEGNVVRLRKRLELTSKSTGETRLFERIEHFDKYGGLHGSAHKTPNFEDVWEDHGNGLVHRVIRDDVPLFGVRFSRRILQATALSFGGIGLLLALSPWRWFRRTMAT